MRTFSGSTAPIRQNSTSRFIVCVRPPCRNSILRQFRAAARSRPGGRTGTPRSRKFSRIAALQPDQRIAASDRLLVHGGLSAHVLQAHGGRAAENVANRVVLRCLRQADPAADRPHGHQQRWSHRRAADKRATGLIAQCGLRVQASAGILQRPAAQSTRSAVSGCLSRSGSRSPRLKVTIHVPILVTP